MRDPVQDRHDQLIAAMAQAIAREFLQMDCAALDEKDYAADFSHNGAMYRRMAAAALAVVESRKA